MKRELIFLLTVLMFASGAAAQEVAPWQNPGVAQIGKATVRPPVISYSTREQATQEKPDQAPHYLSLAGKWRVKHATTQQGGAAQWEDTMLPNLAFMGEAVGLETLRPPLLPAENPTAQYRAQIEVPYMWLDRDLFLYVGGVGGAYTLYINDKKVGYNEDSRTPTEFEISKFVTDGVNTIGLDVTGFSTGTWMETLLTQPVAGTLGEMYLYSQPKLRIADFVVQPKLDSTGLHTVVDITVVMLNSYRGEEPITLGYDIYSPAGKLLTYNLQERVLGAESTDTLRLHETLYNSVKPFSWTPATPNLYKMMFYVRRDKRITEYIPFDLGLNLVEFRDGVFVLNDKPVSINPVRYNAAATETMTRADLQKLKQAKFNTIYVDYPQPAWFYALCDRIGFYVVDQANINSAFRIDDRNVGGNVANNPAYLPAFLDRVEAMRGRSKNYASVIALSLGGESGNGYNLYKTYQYLVGADSLHPITYRGAQGEWNGGVTLPQAEEARRFLLAPAATSKSAPKTTPKSIATSKTTKRR